MAHSPGVNWTCDHCRRQVTLEAGQHPEGWCEVEARPMTNGKTARKWEICGACYSQMERLLMNVEIPE